MMLFKAYPPRPIAQRKLFTDCVQHHTHTDNASVLVLSSRTFGLSSSYVPALVHSADFHDPDLEGR